MGSQSENLVVEKEDLNLIPFSCYGGWIRVSSLFRGKLEKLLSEINVAMIS